MRCVPIFLLFICLVSCADHKPGLDFQASQNDSAWNALQPAAIEHIIARIKQIDAASISDSVYLENEQFLEHTPDGGGSLTAYLEKDEVVKITEWIGLSYGVTVHDFYFDKDALIFVNEKQEYFAVSVAGIDHERFDKAYQGHYFYQNEDLIKYSDSGFKRFLINVKEQAAAFIESAHAYQKLIREQRK